MSDTITLDQLVQHAGTRAARSAYIIREWSSLHHKLSNTQHSDPYSLSDAEFEQLLELTGAVKSAHANISQLKALVDDAAGNPSYRGDTSLTDAVHRLATDIASTMSKLQGDDPVWPHRTSALHNLHATAVAAYREVQ